MISTFTQSSGIKPGTLSTRAMEERRRLPLSLEESNRAKALTVWERISEDVSCPRCSGPPVYHLRTLHRHSVHLSDYVPGAKRGDLIADSLFDLQLQGELEETGALNWSWSKRGRNLHALKNAGQSNGLLDAVSVCMWGVSDSDMVLRTALYNTMAQGSPAHFRIASHEEWRPTGQRVTGENWLEAVELASPRARAAKEVDSPYQRVHLFVLANIIRRPIIVVGGSAEDSDAVMGSTSNPGPRGIYVPWLWESADCHLYPVVLGSSSPWRRFAPLVTAGGALDDADGVAVPLVWGTPRGLRELPLHFPPDGREGARLSCLRAYLKLQTLPLGEHTAYAARLKGHNLPEPFSLVQDYFRLANHMCGQVTQEVKLSGGEEQNGGLPLLACPSSSSSSSSSSSPSTAFSITAHRCATEQCLYFCSKFTWPLCHSCHGNWQQNQQRLQVRDCPPEGRDFSSPDTPPSGPNPASPSRGPSSSVVGDDLTPQGRPAGDLVRRPGVGGAAEDGDFLCGGRCLSCERETPRTFNGLCFRCLQSQSDPPAPAPPPAPPPPDPTDTAGKARASPGREEGAPAGQQRCLTPGCVYFGTARHAGHCTVCYCVQNQTPTHSPPPAPPLPSSSSSSSSSPSPLPLQLSSTLRKLPRCADPACDMLGNSAFQGLCERCFLASHRGATESQASEAMPVGQGSGRVNRRHPRPPSKPDPPSAGTEKAIAAHLESRQSGRGSPGKSQAPAEPDRPRPCLGSGCTNFGNSRCRGLCNSCYRSHV